VHNLELNHEVACPITDGSGVAAPEVGGMASSQEVYSDLKMLLKTLSVKRTTNCERSEGANFVSLFLG
jgi:hypothetical protein